MIDFIVFFHQNASLPELTAVYGSTAILGALAVIIFTAPRGG